MGTPEYAAVSLRRLLTTKHRVRAVVTRPDKPRGRGHKVEAGPVKREAIAAGIEVLEPASPREESFVEQLKALHADLGVVVAYGRILPRAVLAAPRLGCINAHASLLPRLRGAAPIERALLAGMTETGVTIMQMNEGLDEGDVILERSMRIPATMNGAGLRAELAALSAELLVETIDRFADYGAAIRRRPQHHADATFAPPLRKQEASIHWNEDAQALWLRVRAFSPQPGAFATDRGARLKILDARFSRAAHDAAPGTVLGASEEGLLVACGTGVLELLQVQPEGKRAMSALAYERGLKAAGPRILGNGD
ncbi:MAG TPA: methionyl-tRNA formyltransferase [Candidatus Limnocylindrales bacterium]|nr:methionyl-tRNA formyltransferase [Candidatus Limnocylindrales bacterium]